MKVHKLHHTGIVVSDMEESMAFYRDLLGLKEARTPCVVLREGEDISRIVGYADAKVRIAKLWAEDEQHQVELLEYVNPVGGQVSPTARNDVGAAHIGFFVDDIAALRSLLVARGVEFADLPAASPDAENPPVQKAYYVQDPDGNWLEFSEQAPAPAAS